MNSRFKLNIICFIIFTGFFTNSMAGELLHGPMSDGAKVDINQGSIVFYREDSKNIQETPLIFINDNVVGALLPGEYVQARACSSSINLRVASRGDSLRKGALQAVGISRDSITYIKIIEDKNKIFLPIIVDSVQGKEELNGIKISSNLVNRYVPKLVLDGDSLFAFDSTELSSSSRILMDELIGDIAMCPNQVKTLKIIGHTDRLGSDKYNEELSFNRAEAVANYLITNGIDLPLKIEGHGSKEPVTTNCKGKYSSTLIECLQPDRRVVIEY